MKRLLLIMFLLSFFGIAAAQDFAEWQVWSYKTRKGEESSHDLDQQDRDASQAWENLSYQCIWRESKKTAHR